MSEKRGAGIAMVLVAGLIYSTAGLFARALPLDAWTILGWRAVFGTAFMLAWMGIENGRGLPAAFALPPRALLLTVPTALSGICYIVALKLTTVADVMVVYATMPFVTALVAWAWVGEMPDRRMMTAGAVALAGVLVMVGGGSGSGSRLAGMASAFGMNIGMAVILVNARRGARAGNAVYTLGTALSGAVGFALAPRTGISGADLALLAPFGLLTIGLAMALYMAGARRMPPAEVGLISMLDVASGPGLMWFAFGEEPSPTTIVGGAVVVAALFWHLAPDVRQLLRPA
jgi:drug/metabolite transporter (DMT)-like permease